MRYLFSEASTKRSGTRPFQHGGFACDVGIRVFDCDIRTHPVTYKIEANL